MGTIIQHDTDILNETLRTIYDRRSVRLYLDRPVPIDLVGRVIDAGKMAPSDMNHQPWKFYVLTIPDTIRAFSREIQTCMKGLSHRFAAAFGQAADPIFHGAPVVILLAAPTKNEWAALDLGMCAQNMMLAARSLGLDSCPVGLAKYIQKTSIVSTLNLDPRDEVLLAVILGYGAERPEPHARVANNVNFIP